MTVREAQSEPSLHCPACGGSLGAVVLRSFDRVFDLAGEFDVRECVACGIGVTEPRLDGEALARYYPDNYGSWKAEEQSLLLRLKRARTRLSAQARPYGSFLRRGDGGDLLDVGCGRGDLATAFAAAGWRVRALDSSPRAVAAACAGGIDARVGTIETASWPPASFDLLILSHTLEHVQDPAGALRHARRLLRRGGFLIVAVPNWDSWQRKLFGARWALVEAPRHLQHFTAGALHELAGSAGFRRGRTRRSVSASSLAVTLQYVACDRWKLTGAAREAFLAAAVVLYPLGWVVGRPLGGDCVYLVAEA